MTGQDSTHLESAEAHDAVNKVVSQLMVFKQKQPHTKDSMIIKNPHNRENETYICVPWNDSDRAAASQSQFWESIYKVHGDGSKFKSAKRAVRHAKKYLNNAFTKFLEEHNLYPPRTM